MSVESLPETPESRRHNRGMNRSRPQFPDPSNLQTIKLSIPDKSPMNNSGSASNRNSSIGPNRHPHRKSIMINNTRRGQPLPLSQINAESRTNFSQKASEFYERNQSKQADSQEDPVLSYLAYESAQKRQSKVLKHQEDALNHMMANQERLIQQINEQKQAQIELELRYRRELSRARELPPVTRQNSREREYANLEMLNKLGDSMKNGDYSMDFLFNSGVSRSMSRVPVGPTSGYDEIAVVRDADEFLPNGMNLIQRDMRGILRSNNEPRTNDAGSHLERRRREEVPYTQKPHKKKKKQNVIKMMLPLIMMSQMRVGKDNGESEKLFRALDLQNKVLASLSNDISRRKGNEFDSEKSSLEEKIKELEKKMTTKQNGPYYY